MSLYVTTHNAEGKAIFSGKVLQEVKKNEITIGDIRIISSTHKFPVDLSTESDIEQYNQDCTQPIFPGARRICPDGGTAVCIMSLKPGVGKTGGILHRTMTLDVLVVIEGEIEIHLDSGEMKVVKTGDSIVQRATMHKWVNVTPNNGWARWVVFIQAAADAVHIGDKMLVSEWSH
jgi:mannose-6-phosphate isomerase-like protein (cupin superfamily)